MVRLVFLISVLLLPLGSRAGIVAIIIDDIGYNYRESLKAIQLPPEITLSVLPDSPHAVDMVSRAKEHGHELMLHVPMQSVSKGQAHEPNVLNTGMDEHAVREMLEAQLDRFPEMVGINNHQGSLLTQKEEPMTWVMQVLLERGDLYFVDSRTHSQTVAGEMARRMGVPESDRDVFLDPNGNDAKSIARSVQRVLETVEKDGFALAIGHPFPHTIQAIKRLRRELLARGHTLVKASSYIQQQEVSRWSQR
ncbi:MAG: divergent polysaccharide deacetylase family protein [bacterium]